jgi:DNA ligase-4
MDGERMQIHMADSGNTFKFYSRKAKDYTYLYGSSYDDTTGSLTRHLRSVINRKVKKCAVLLSCKYPTNPVVYLTVRW